MLALAFPVPASAAVQDASEAPRTSGPLVPGSPLGCEDDGPPGPGESRGQSCAWAYDLVPADTNAAEDFVGYWIQMEANPAPGMCVKRMHFDTTGPQSARLVSATPSTGKARGATTVELVVDGEGAAPAPGTIAQDVDLPKGRVRTTLRPHRFTYDWAGNAPGKVVLAFGVQWAYQVPPSFAPAWAEGLGMAIGPCRGSTIRLGGR